MRVILLGALLGFVVACSKPVPPTLAPKRANVTSISPSGIGVEVTLLVTNPNSIDIPAREAKAHVVLDKQIEVGLATVDENVTLPANQTTEMKVAVSLPWNNVMPLLGLAMSDRSIPYTIDGTLALGGELVSVELPFTIDGTVSHDQIVKATMNSIPAIPGVTVPGADPGAPAPAPAPTPGPGPTPGRRPHTRH
jgi:LEA14-like dessication related protein